MADKQGRLKDSASKKVDAAFSSTKEPRGSVSDYQRTAKYRADKLLGKGASKGALSSSVDKGMKPTQLNDVIYPKALTS